PAPPPSLFRFLDRNSGDAALGARPAALRPADRRGVRRDLRGPARRQSRARRRQQYHHRARIGRVLILVVGSPFPFCPSSVVCVRVTKYLVPQCRFISPTRTTPAPSGPAPTSGWRPRSRWASSSCSG